MSFEGSQCVFGPVIGDLLSEASRLDERITAYDAHIRSMARGKDNPAQQPMRLSGIGDITTTAITARGKQLSLKSS